MADSGISRRHGRSTDAALLTLGGLAAAFGAASCCGLPLLLASLGFGSAWLTGLGLLAAPNRLPLLALGATGLAGGAILLWRQWRTAACTQGALCGWPAFRGTIIAGLLVGGLLLYLGFAYA